MPNECLLLTDGKVTEHNKNTFTNSLGRQNSVLQPRLTTCHYRHSLSVQRKHELVHKGGGRLRGALSTQFPEPF